MAATAATAKLLPWGRLVLQKKTRHSPLPDHCDLLRSKHCVGRVASRSDIQIPKQFLSALHCIIRLKGKNARGEPEVEIEDVSRYGVWVNGVRVGTRRKAQLKKGDLLDFNPPDAKERVCYKLEILPSGLTKQNEELHGRLSADEMSVADRTRKRTIEDTQCTQSPSKPVLSPPRPRPVKKRRRGANSQQTEEPASEPACTPATLQSAAENEPQDPPPGTSGKNRSRSVVQPPSSKLAKIQEENIKYAQSLAKRNVELDKMSELLVKSQTELASLKKAHAEELANLRKDIEALENEKKIHDEEMKKAAEKAKADLDNQAEAARKESNELRHERDVLRRTIEDVLTDPNTPKQVRTVVELEAKIHELRRTLKQELEQCALQDQHNRSLLTPPSKKQILETERRAHWGRLLVKGLDKDDQEQKRHEAARAKITQENRKIAETISTMDTSISSGSSQSQDSIDAGRLQGNRRSSQLSLASNEHSEPSPGDLPLTIDEETKSGDTPQGRPPLFNRFGASTSGDNAIRPATLSGPHFHRSTSRDRVGEEESKGAQDAVEDEETKGDN